MTPESGPQTKISPDEDFSARLNMARDAFNDLQTSIQAADQKVQFVLTANAFLAATLSFQGSQALAQIAKSGLTTPTALTIVMGGLILIGIVASTIFTVMTLLPRVSPSYRRSLFFFSDIANTPPDSFVEEFMALDGEEVYRQVLYQVHVNAKIVERKFLWARWATLALAVTLFIWVVAAVLKFLF
jgi:Pycsar effector protein